MYSSIGVAAPVLLSVLRAVQGLGMGGEFGTAVSGTADGEGGGASQGCRSQVLRNSHLSPLMDTSAGTLPILPPDPFFTPLLLLLYTADVHLGDLAQGAAGLQRRGAVLVLHGELKRVVRGGR